MPFFRKSTPEVEIPVGVEREDLLAGIARRAGERKQQVQSLLEEFARREDERAQPPAPEPPSFQKVLEQVEPAVAKTPLLSMERRWSTKPPEPVANVDTVAQLQARVAALETEQKKLVGIVESLIAVVSAARTSKGKAAGER